MCYFAVERFWLLLFSWASSFDQPQSVVSCRDFVFLILQPCNQCEVGQRAVTRHPTHRTADVT